MIAYQLALLALLPFHTLGAQAGAIRGSVVSKEEKVEKIKIDNVSNSLILSSFTILDITLIFGPFHSRRHIDILAAIKKAKATRKRFSWLRLTMSMTITIYSTVLCI